MRKILTADTLTPILAYMRVQGEHKVILESIPREKESARFSIVAYNPVFEIKYENGEITENGQVITGDPLDYLNYVTVKGEATDLPFGGGAIGFVGYDMISLYENIRDIPEDTIETPDMHFFVYESYLIFDHKTEKVYVVEDNIYSHRDNDATRQALGKVVKDLQTQALNEFSPQELHPLTFKHHIEKEKFEQIVNTAKKLIREGDMFQCVLSQRFSSPFEGDPLDYYRNLRVTNPSNYLYFYDFGDYQIIGASPESLVSVKNGEVTTNPIAGTRPRGANDAEDAVLAKDLQADIKETAEHRMLVDLGRNDIGRISQNGTVKVTKYMEVEYFRYVMHGKQSDIELLAESPVFSNLANELPIMRYHSIVVTEMPEEFEVVAKTTDDQEIMAIQHKNLPIYGLQFHPESIGSPGGLQMIENFVRLVIEK